MQQITRRYFLTLSALLIGSTMLPSSLFAVDAAAARPNVILCMTNDQGWGDAGYNGPEGKKSAPGRTEGLKGRKRSLYEGGVHVPGLLVWPNMIKKGRVVSMPCTTSDYFPTVLDALGYKLPKEQERLYDGISLIPMIEGTMSERSKPIAFESKNQISLTDNRYKIYSKNNGKTYELYDLLADQEEKINIADQHPETVKRMKKTLKEWRSSCTASRKGSDY